MTDPEEPRHRPTGKTPLMMACELGRTLEVKIHLQKKPLAVTSRDRNGKTALHYCAESGSAACAQLIVASDPALIGAHDNDGLTPLHLAVIAGNRSVARLLLRHGAQPDALDKERHSALHWAAVCSDVESAELLLAHSADASASDVLGACPLHYAAQMCAAHSLNGKDPESGLATLRKLVEGGAPLHSPDRDGREPLLWAASAGSSEAVLILFAAGANIAASDKDGLTALHCAASRGYTSCVETLVTMCGARVDSGDALGCSPSFYAAAQGHADALQILLKYAADPNHQDDKGRTPAHCAASKGQLEVLKILDSNGADLWMRNSRGNLPLHEAVQSGRKDLVQWLLQQCPQAVNATNMSGRTPLHIAAQKNNVNMCEVLIDYAAHINPLMVNAKGFLMSALDVAVYQGNQRCAKYLQLHGAVPATKVLENNEINRNLLFSLGNYAYSHKERSDEEPFSAAATNLPFGTSVLDTPVHRDSQTRTLRAGQQPTPLPQPEVPSESLLTNVTSEEVHIHLTREDLWSLWESLMQELASEEESSEGRVKQLKPILTNVYVRTTSSTTHPKDVIAGESIMDREGEGDAKPSTVPIVPQKKKEKGQKAPLPKVPEVENTSQEQTDPQPKKTEHPDPHQVKKRHKHDDDPPSADPSDSVGSDTEHRLTAQGVKVTRLRKRRSDGRSWGREPEESETSSGHRPDQRDANPYLKRYFQKQARAAEIRNQASGEQQDGAMEDYDEYHRRRHSRKHLDADQVEEGHRKKHRRKSSDALNTRTHRRHSRAALKDGEHTDRLKVKCSCENSSISPRRKSEEEDDSPERKHQLKRRGSKKFLDVPSNSRNREDRNAEEDYHHHHYHHHHHHHHHLHNRPPLSRETSLHENHHRYLENHKHRRHHRRKRSRKRIGDIEERKNISDGEYDLYGERPLSIIEDPRSRSEMSGIPQRQSLNLSSSFEKYSESVTEDERKEGDVNGTVVKVAESTSSVHHAQSKKDIQETETKLDQTVDKTPQGPFSSIKPDPVSIRLTKSNGKTSDLKKSTTKKRDMRSRSPKKPEKYSVRKISLGTKKISSRRKSCPRPFKTAYSMSELLSKKEEEAELSPAKSQSAGLGKSSVLPEIRLYSVEGDSTDLLVTEHFEQKEESVRLTAPENPELFCQEFSNQNEFHKETKEVDEPMNSSQKIKTDDSEVHTKKKKGGSHQVDKKKQLKEEVSIQESVAIAEFSEEIVDTAFCELRDASKERIQNAERQIAIDKLRSKRLTQKQKEDKRKLTLAPSHKKLSHQSSIRDTEQNEIDEDTEKSSHAVETKQTEQNEIDKDTEKSSHAVSKKILDTALKDEPSTSKTKKGGKSQEVKPFIDSSKNVVEDEKSIDLDNREFGNFGAIKDLAEREETVKAQFKSSKQHEERNSKENGLRGEENYIDDNEEPVERPDTVIKKKLDSMDHEENGEQETPTETNTKPKLTHLEVARSDSLQISDDESGSEAETRFHSDESEEIQPKSDLADLLLLSGESQGMENEYFGISQNGENSDDSSFPETQNDLQKTTSSNGNRSVECKSNLKDFDEDDTFSPDENTQSDKEVLSDPADQKPTDEDTVGYHEKEHSEDEDKPVKDAAQNTDLVSFAETENILNSISKHVSVQEKVVKDIASQTLIVKGETEFYSTPVEADDKRCVPEQPKKDKKSVSVQTTGRHRVQKYRGIPRSEIQKKTVAVQTEIPLSSKTDKEKKSMSLLGIKAPTKDGTKSQAQTEVKSNKSSPERHNPGALFYKVNNVDQSPRESKSEVEAQKQNRSALFYTAPELSAEAHRPEKLPNPQPETKKATPANRQTYSRGNLRATSRDRTLQSEKAVAVANTAFRKLNSKGELTVFSSSLITPALDLSHGGSAVIMDGSKPSCQKRGEYSNLEKPGFLWVHFGSGSSPIHTLRRKPTFTSHKQKQGTTKDGHKDKDGDDSVKTTATSSRRQVTTRKQQIMQDSVNRDISHRACKGREVVKKKVAFDTPSKKSPLKSSSKIMTNKPLEIKESTNKDSPCRTQPTTKNIEIKNSSTEKMAIASLSKNSPLKLSSKVQTNKPLLMKESPKKVSPCRTQPIVKSVEIKHSSMDKNRISTSNRAKQDSGNAIFTSVPSSSVVSESIQRTKPEVTNDEKTKTKVEMPHREVAPREKSARELPKTPKKSNTNSSRKESTKNNKNQSQDTDKRNDTDSKLNRGKDKEDDEDQPEKNPRLCETAKSSSLDEGDVRLVIERKTDPGLSIKIKMKDHQMKSYKDRSIENTDWSSAQWESDQSCVKDSGYISTSESIHKHQRSITINLGHTTAKINTGMSKDYEEQHSLVFPLVNGSGKDNQSGNTCDRQKAITSKLPVLEGQRPRGNSMVFSEYNRAPRKDSMTTSELSADSPDLATRSGKLLEVPVYMEALPQQRQVTPKRTPLRRSSIPIYKAFSDGNLSVCKSSASARLYKHSLSTPSIHKDMRTSCTMTPGRKMPSIKEQMSTPTELYHSDTDINLQSSGRTKLPSILLYEPEDDKSLYKPHSSHFPQLGGQASLPPSRESVKSTKSLALQLPLLQQPMRCRCTIQPHAYWDSRRSRSAIDCMANVHFLSEEELTAFESRFSPRSQKKESSYRALKTQALRRLGSAGASSERAVTFHVDHQKERNTFKLPTDTLEKNKKWKVVFTIGKNGGKTKKKSAND